MTIASELFAGTSVGQLVPIGSSVSISTDTTIEFTSDIDSTFDVYEMHIKDLLVSDDNTSLLMRVSVDAGASWYSSANYEDCMLGGDSGGSGRDKNSHTGATAFYLSDDLAANSIGDQTDASYNAVISIYRPTASKYIKVKSKSVYENGGQLMWAISSGLFTISSAAFDGFQLLMSAGTLDSGTVDLYGVKK